VVTLDDIRAAADGLSGVAHRTPTERSETFTRLCGGEVWLKFENQQRTGSFKIRGAYTKIQSLSPAERAAGVVAPSAGNHAQAVAFAARSAGVDATVYMPEAASLAKVGATEGYGATVRLVGDSVEGSVEAAKRAVHDEGRTLVHPFDDEVVIAGQGTVGLEILQDAPRGSRSPSRRCAPRCA
jgi:threonine dehydratase